MQNKTGGGGGDDDDPWAAGAEATKAAQAKAKEGASDNAYENEFEVGIARLARLKGT